MENIIELIKNYDVYIILVMLLIAVGLILIIIIFSRLNKVEDRYKGHPNVWKKVDFVRGKQNSLF